MKSKTLLIIIPLVSSILLSGCSFEDLFAKFATTNEEQGAWEQINRSEIIAAKQKRIDAKKGEFDHFSKLTKVNESDPFDAFVFYTLGEDATKIDLEAVLPNPNRQIYEAWVRNPETKATISLGAFQYNDVDDYSLSYTGNIDLKDFSSLIVSRESNPDDQPETVLMTGALTTSTP